MSHDEPDQIGFVVAALGLLALPSGSALAGDAAHPTVIELFQSQGCSSCPPAEANVGAVSDRSDVLALSFEVDYWDRLGWKDTSRRPPGRRASMPMPDNGPATASTRPRSSSTAGPTATA